MAYQTKTDLSADKTYSLGGVDKKSNKKNPTQVEGFYLGSRVTKDTGYGPGLLHFFQCADGNHAVWGKTRLNTLLTDDLRGQMVLAQFTGMSPKRPGKNPAYLFKVQHDPDQTIDVSGVDLNAAPEPTPAEDYDNPPPQEAGDEPSEESDPSAEEAQVDQVQAARPTPPRAPAATPSAERQAKVQAMLNKGKTGTGKPVGRTA